MTRGACIVAVDVGNSAVKLCVRRERESGAPESGDQNSDVNLIDHSIVLTNANWAREAVDWVREHAGCRQTHWRIASVHRSAADELEATISDLQANPQATELSDGDLSDGDLGDGVSGDQVLHSTVSQSMTLHNVSRVTHRDVPMKMTVDHPQRLGIDRLIGAYAASNRYQHPLVVVDAGSAVTVDWVDAQNTFCGGAILPGLRLQTQALASGTDALPQIDWQASGEISAPASNTVEAIQLGVLTGLAAGIDRLAARYIGQAQETTTASEETMGVSEGEDCFYIVLTGGDAHTLSPHLYGAHVVIPNLVCRGLLDLTS